MILRKGSHPQKDDFITFVNYIADSWANESKYDIIISTSSKSHVTKIITDILSSKLGIPAISGFKKKTTEEVIKQAIEDGVPEIVGEKRWNFFLQRQFKNTISMTAAPTEIRPLLKIWDLDEDIELTADKNVLIIDDILFTGSTIIDMAKQISGFSNSTEAFVLIDAKAQ